MQEQSIDRRTALKITAAGIVSVGMVDLQQTSAAPATKPAVGWPMANGPYGNFRPAASGHKLVNDLTKVRLAWKSEDSDLGYGKGSVSGYIANLARWPGHPGSCSGPIVADGKVFCTSFRPTGKLWAENTPHLKHDKNRRWLNGKQTARQLQQNLRIDADDLLLAVDQKTGKTAWKAVEKGRGVNRYMGKREGFAVAPAYFDGTVFSIGTTGRLYAYDAETGKKRWETHLGKAHAAMEAKKERALEEKRLADTFGWDASPVIAEGVLVVPVFDHSVDTSLRGVDPKTGKTKWELPAATSRYATPSLYRHEGREYLLKATRRGVMQLIDPRNGKILWQVAGLQPTWFALTPSESHVLVNAGSKSKQKSKRDRPFGLPACYRLSPKSAERVWTMPDRKEFWFENHMDSCARRKIVIHNGLVFYHTQNKAGGEKNRFFSLLNERTGDVLTTTDTMKGTPLFYIVEDRMLYVPDAWHSDRLTMELYTTDPKTLRKLGSEWKPPHTSTTGYEVAMEIPYVDGCLFMRTRAGDIQCYDLRRDAGRS